MRKHDDQREACTVSKFLLMLLLFIPLLSSCSSPTETGAQPETPIRTVEVADVKEGVFDEGLTLSGKVKGHVEVAVVPKTGGRVERIGVQVGNRVRPGDLIVQLDTRDVLAQAEQAEAALKVAEAGKESAAAQSAQQIMSAEQGEKQAQEALRQAEKGLEAARYAYDLAVKNLERQQSLLESGLASETAVEQAENGLKQAEAALQQAESGHANALKALEVAQENLKIANERLALKAAEAQVAQAKAGVDAARRLLENMRVTAPVAGVVASLSAKVGAMVGPQDVVATIVDMDPAIVEVDLPEQAYADVEAGDPVTVTVRSETFEGKVITKNLTSDPRTKAYSVKIEIPNKDGRLISGQSATVAFRPKGAKPSVLIPAEAYMESEKAGQGRVMVYEDGVVHERRVTVGRQSTASVEVTSGLKPGEKVVVKGQYLLKEGDKVRLAGEAQP